MAEVEYDVFFPEELEMFEVAGEPEGEVITRSQRGVVARHWVDQIREFRHETEIPNMRDLTLKQAERLYDFWGEDKKELYAYGKGSMLLISAFIIIIASGVAFAVAWSTRPVGLIILGIILVISIISRLVANQNKKLNNFNDMRKSALGDIAFFRKKEQDEPHEQWYLIHRGEDGHIIRNSDYVPDDVENNSEPEGDEKDIADNKDKD